MLASSPQFLFFLFFSSFAPGAQSFGGSPATTPRDARARVPLRRALARWACVRACARQPRTPLLLLGQTDRQRDRAGRGSCCSHPRKAGGRDRSVAKSSREGQVNRIKLFFGSISFALKVMMIEPFSHAHLRTPQQQSAEL